MWTKARVLFTMFGLIIVGGISKYIKHDSYNTIYMKMIIATVLLYILSIYCEDHIIKIISKGKCRLNKKYCKK